ncbi:hypothetical protein SAMN05216563_107288 [Phytobacter palmae]|nr:hypothetical protein SAMN05216563_107288 [Phytobacter palmae]
MENIKKIIYFAILMMLGIGLYFSVQYNSFNVVSAGIHDNYQRESESLVLSALYADKNNIPTQGWRLGYIASPETNAPDIMFAYDNFEKPGGNQLKFIPYVSQWGIQSAIFKALGSVFDIKTVIGLKAINSIMFVLTIMILAILYYRLFNATFALIFCISLIFSPWIVPIARNLYWVPFTWFLPAIFSAMYFLAESVIMKRIALVMIFISFAIKCMAGYEYITSITLLTCAPVFLAPYLGGKIHQYNIKDFVLIFSVCVFSFMVVLVIHAGMRGDSILHGLQNIYEYDVKRRTYGDASHFENVEIQKSLNVSTWYVLRIYLFDWTTNVVKFISGSLFPWLLGITLALCIISGNKKRIIAFAYVLCIPLSWYILAKGHSEVHVFINFVLWYMLFVPLMLYLVVSFVRSAISMLLLRVKASPSLLHK